MNLTAFTDTVLENSNSKIFVTGSNGFIGHELILELAKSNYKVIAASRKKDYIRKTELDGFKNIKHCVYDDFEIGVQWLSFLGDSDIVIHCGGLAHLSYGDKSVLRQKFQLCNVEATRDLALAAAASGVKRFIFLSSIGVNGVKSKTPFKETDIVNPNNYYTISKWEAEKVLDEVRKSTNMEVVVVRLPLVYGPGVPGKFNLLLKIASFRIPLPLASIHNKRSFLAVDNLTNFLVFCCDLKRSIAVANELFILADGIDISTPDLLRKWAKVKGVSCFLWPLPIPILEMFANLIGKKSWITGLTSDLQVDCSKVKNLTGWYPIITMDEQLKKFTQIRMEKK